ncbi:MAG: 50S ribosomal protein L4 [Gammaproteobacteria bacterium]|nr:50S ribosomal protein L4 [Gammaproteobacteria bacterium]
MELKFCNVGGAKERTGGVEVADSAFGRAFNPALVHQVVTAYLAGGRAGSKAQKTRAMVQGGNSKPWRQKGTGRARAGSTRSPIWVGGGRAFAAQPRDHSQKVNRKMYRAAMQSILSELVRQERLKVVDVLEIDAPKTRALAGKLRDMGLTGGLIVLDEIDEKLALAARNLRGVQLATAAGVSPADLVAHEAVVMTVAAIKRLEEKLA